MFEQTAATTYVSTSLFHVSTADGLLLQITNELDQACQASAPQAVVEEKDIVKLRESDPSSTPDDANSTDNKSVVTPTRPDQQIRPVVGNEGARRGRKLRDGLERPYRCPVRNISHVVTCFAHRLTERWLYQGSLPLSFSPTMSDGEKGLSEQKRARLSP